MGDLPKEMFPSTAPASRDALRNTPIFLEKIFCPAWIIGESYDSGHDPGLEVMPKRREV